MPCDAWPSDETPSTSAWMGHTSHVRRAEIEQMTGYNCMANPRVKGKRRKVWRMLSRRSQKLLERYRRTTRQACCMVELISCLGRTENRSSSKGN